MHALPLTLALALTFWGAPPTTPPTPAWAASPGRHGDGHDHAPGAHGHAPRERGQHGNPADMAGYIKHLEDPTRDAWQKPDEVVRALKLRPGQTACDVGAGPGYFTFRLARSVGTAGRVYAVDVEAKMIEALRDRLGALPEGTPRNVIPVLALPDDPLLPDGACDLVLIVDTYHHFPDGPAYLGRLMRALTKGGRIVNVDYHKRQTPVGPPLDHRIAREAFIADAAGAGLVVAGEEKMLPHQYFVVLRAK